MAFGKPIVAPQVGGIPELIDHGVDGILFQPFDKADLEQSIADVVRSPARGRVLGSQARRRAAACFGLPAMVKKYEDVYEELYASQRERDA
jgi:glycosyltransferase involved in cell wall biosynthesis